MRAGALSKAKRHRSNLQRYLSTSPPVSCQESLILQGNKRKRAASLLKGTLPKAPRSHAISEVIALVTRYSIRCERPFAQRMTSHRFGVSRGVQPLLERRSKGVSPLSVLPPKRSFSLAEAPSPCTPLPHLRKREEKRKRGCAPPRKLLPFHIGLLPLSKGDSEEFPYDVCSEAKARQSRGYQEIASSWCSSQ